MMTHDSFTHGQTAPSIESEHFAVKVLNASLSGIYVHDVKLGINVFINQQYSALTGYTREDFQSLDKTRFFELFHPDDRRQVAGHMQAIVHAGDEMLEIEYRFRTRDGRWIWCLSREKVFTRDSDGTVRQLIGTVLDISDRKQAELELTQKRGVLQSIFDNIPVLFILWDQPSRRFTLNRHAEALLGWTTDEANQGDFINRLAPEAPNRAEVDEFMRSLKPGWSQWRIKTKDGEQVPIDWANIRISDDTIIGVGIDLRDRRQAEENLRQTQVKLALQLLETKRINDELAQYAYAISHDLKSPMRGIQNYSDFLYEDLSGSITGDQRIYLDGLKKAVSEASELVDDLLRFSRIDGIPPETETADVPDLVNEVRSMLDLPPEVEMTVASEWPHFSVNRTLLKQTLTNLISNSVKFNESNPKRIKIGWRAAPDKHIEIYVRDNGIGIDPQYYQQIFRVFQRLHAHTTYGGTGIGLSIVKKAAENMGGSVHVESTVGKGSTFYVKLPLFASKSPFSNDHRKTVRHI